MILTLGVSSPWDAEVSWKGSEGILTPVPHYF
jgi:hypothetical protein